MMRMFQFMRQTARSQPFFPKREERFTRFRSTYIQTYGANPANAKRGSGKTLFQSPVGRIMRVWLVGCGDYREITGWATSVFGLVG